MPGHTSSEVEQRVIDTRRRYRRGADWLGPELGIPPRTMSRILRRHQIPYLAKCDPLTGEVIRASKTTVIRYKRDRSGELIHIDVKKLGRIPPSSGWRAWGRGATDTTANKKRRVGYEYVHSAVDDRSPVRLLRDPPRRNR